MNDITRILVGLISVFHYLLEKLDNFFVLIGGVRLHYAYPFIEITVVEIGLIIISIKRNINSLFKSSKDRAEPIVRSVEILIDTKKKNEMSRHQILLESSSNNQNFCRMKQGFQTNSVIGYIAADNQLNYCR